GVDLSRTVGWFTTKAPVQLGLGQDVVSSLRGVKGALHGIGERLLDHGLRGGGSEAEVSFNYLGQWDNLGGGGEEGLIEPAEGLMGGMSTAERRPRLIDVNAMVVDGRLQMHWGYSAALHRRETVERYAERTL